MKSWKPPLQSSSRVFIAIEKWSHCHLPLPLCTEVIKDTWFHIKKANSTNGNTQYVGKSKMVTE